MLFRWCYSSLDVSDRVIVAAFQTYFANVTQTLLEMQFFYFVHVYNSYIYFTYFC